MSQRTLIVIDRDVQYLELLTAYIRNSEYADKLVVKCFSSPMNGVQYLRSSLAQPILLLQEELVDADGNWPPSMILLSEKDFNNSDEQPRKLYKYQPLHHMFSKILGSSSSAPVKIYGDRKTDVITFFSASGQSGKTTAAFNLSKSLALLNHRVLYLNLELLPSMDMGGMGVDVEQNTLADIIYCVREYPERLVEKIDLSALREPNWKFDYIPPATSFREIQEMTATDVQILIEQLCELNRYDYIVVDPDSSIHPRIITLLNASDIIFWLVTDDYHHLQRTHALLKQMPVSLEQIHFVMNKYTGSISNSSITKDLMIRGFLPYIPGWKTVHNREQLMYSDIYNRQLLHLFNGMRRSSRGDSIAE